VEIRIADIDPERLLKRSLKNGGDFAELYIENKTGTSIISEANKIEKFLITQESGMALRVIMGERSAYAYTNDVSSLDELADTVASAVRSGDFTRVIPLAKRAPTSIVLKEIDPERVDPQDKISLVQRAQRMPGIWMDQWCRSG
jgi:TldD protein